MLSAAFIATSAMGTCSIRLPRQAVAVLAALVPVSLLVTLARQLLLPELQLVPSVAITSACNVVALTWLLMPIVTKALHPWLIR